MRNFSLTTAAATLLVASTIAQADDSSIAGASTDTLGLPSSALILTDVVAADTRGQSWKEYMDAKTYWLENKCRYRINQEINTDDECTILDGGSNDGLEYLWEQWKDAIELHEGVILGTETNDIDEAAEHRSDSY